MKKNYILFILTVGLFLFLHPSTAYAVHQELKLGDMCREEDGNFLTNEVTGEVFDCAPKLVCVKPSSTSRCSGTWCCQTNNNIVNLPGVFGVIELPQPIRNLGFANIAISRIINNVIILIYIAAAIIFIFMVVISAVQWILSGGDKEAVGKARSRLTYAIIGIVLLALSFVVIKLVGQVTGFEFFQGQNNTIQLPPSTCPPGQEWNELYQSCSDRRGY